MAADLGFPVTIGPFTMTRAELPRAFNSFWQQFGYIPKPDPESNENSMAGMDPQQAGMGSGDIVFCQLSPLHLITLDAETKVAANIPAAATYFAWAYPLVLEPGAQRPRGPAEAAFVDYGGYIYFNDEREVVGTNSITPAPLGTLGLMFGRPQPLSEDVAEILVRQGRFQEITLKPLADKGATHFAWIRPGEFIDSVYSADGCFAYKFEHDCPKYFPVVSKPIFTKELAEESLEESEAWIVGRFSSPTIESAIIFDKRKTLEENLYNNSHGLDVPSDVSLAKIGRDSRTGFVMTYEEWRCSLDQGSLADPFVFHLLSGNEAAATGVNSSYSAAAEILGVCMD